MSEFEIPHDYKPNRGDMPAELAEQQGDRCLDCGEPQAHAYHQATKLLESSDWAGDNPFWLMFEKPEGGNIGVDLDEGGWVETNKVHMRSPGTWFLMAKRTGRPLFSIVMNEGDQFFYAKRTVGNTSTANKAICYGIGKKQADKVPVSLWLLPSGVVCGGDDVFDLAARMLGPRPG